MADATAKESAIGSSSANATINDEKVVVRVKSEPASAGPEDNLRDLLERRNNDSSREKTTAAPQVATPRAAFSGGPRAPNSTGQQTITSYFASSKTAAQTTSEQSNKKADDDEVSKTPAIDLESIRGLFGWMTLEGVHIPFILRQEEKFTAVRIIERTLLKKYLQALPPDVYSCTYIKSYFITDNEAKLLNEINLKHCDRQYGNELFSTKDLVVQLNDVEQLYEFLSTCYYKLAHSAASQQHPEQANSRKTSRCGIVKMEGNFVPYVQRNQTKFVPLSLFKEGSLFSSLEMKAEKLDSWDLSYMKFCCKVAGIDKQFLKESTCSVISLDDLKQAVSPNVSFQEWWPSSRSADATAADRFKLPFHQLLQAASNTRYDKTIASALHNLFVCASSPKDNQSVEPKETTSGSNSVSESKGYKNGHVSYPMHPVNQAPYRLSTAAVATNPQAFLYNGQWWGSLTSSPSASADGQCYPPGSIHCQSLAAHFPQGPTQCSPSNATANHLNHNSLMYPTPAPLHMAHHYAHPTNHHANLTSTKSTSRELRVSSERSEEQLSDRDRLQLMSPSNKVHYSRQPPPPLASMSHSDLATRGVQHDRPSDSDGHFHNLSKRPPPPLVHNSSEAAKISDLSGLSSSADINGSAFQHGLYGTTIGQQLELLRAVAESGTSAYLAKHFLNNMNNGSLERSRALSESFVVAPGSVQALAGKMSSPKPANQVPATVAGGLDLRHRSMASDGVTRTATGHPKHLVNYGGVSSASSPQIPTGSSVDNRGDSASKLHELLSERLPKPQSSSVYHCSSSQNSVPRYKIQQLLLSGSKLIAINSVDYEHRNALMVPIAEVVRLFQPCAAVDLCEHILTRVFGVPLFECNRPQEDLLKKHVDALKGARTIRLIRADDLVKYLPQLTYSVSKLAAPEQRAREPVAKRIRVGSSVGS